jgi:hypothetical protein
VLALTTSNTDAVGRAMLAASEHRGVGGRFLVTRPRTCGAQIVADTSVS